MIGKSFLKFTVNWLVFVFWSSALFLLMLPYQIYRVFAPKRKTGRPGSHPVSKFFRKAFESKKVKRFAGAGLAILLMFSGLISNVVAANEPLIDETILAIPDTEVVTERSLEIPLEGVLGQGFHSFHKGIDILAPIGTPIKPIANGIIREASFGRLGWGNTVVVEHENGLASRYAHLRNIKVVEGETVNKNQEIGDVGMTGWTTGPHLHLEVYQNGQVINPAQVLPEFSSILTGK